VYTDVTHGDWFNNYATIARVPLLAGESIHTIKIDSTNKDYPQHISNWYLSLEEDTENLLGNSNGI
jgi:hypothetical protein